MSIQPNFQVYVDPRPLGDMNPLYHAPPAQEEFIQRLFRAGYHPMVNAVKQPTRAEVRSAIGLVYLENGDLQIASKYDEGKIRCILWYNDDLLDLQLEIIKKYMLPVYRGASIDSIEVAAEHQYLVDLGCFKPVVPAKAIGDTTFIKSHQILDGK